MDAQPHDLSDPWLVAVWPGLGSVALGAGAYLVERLGAKQLEELDAADHFDIDKIEVRDGVAQPGRMPRSTFYTWKAPAGGQDLLIFVGEAQPASRGFRFCGRLLDRAVELGASRVLTFAALPTPVHPTAKPRVVAVVNQARLLREVRDIEGVSLLKEGEITGLNGVLLAAAHERTLPGFCLLGELPFFPFNVPNPKASAAVLRVFRQMARLELDLAELDRHATNVERGLVEFLDKMQRAQHSAKQQDSEEGEGEGFSLPSFAKEDDEAEGASEREGGEEREEPKRGGGLDAPTHRRIELLFERARNDRSKAVELKSELDKLGVYKAYEDRFLDLFKRGE